MQLSQGSFLSFGEIDLLKSLWHDILPKHAQFTQPLCIMDSKLFVAAHPGYSMNAVFCKDEILQAVRRHLPIKQIIVQNKMC